MTNPQEQHVLEANPTIVTTIEKHRVVAHSYGQQSEVDALWELGEQVKKLSKDWDKTKESLREKAKVVLASIAKTNLFSKLVLLHGSKGNYIEIQASTKKKAVNQDLVDECAFHSVNVLVEEKEVVLSGPLAQWAIENLSKYTKSQTLEDHCVVKSRYVLADNFVEAYETSTEMKPLFERLKDAGFNAPSVECKVAK